MHPFCSFRRENRCSCARHARSACDSICFICAKQNRTERKQIYLILRLFQFLALDLARAFCISIADSVDERRRIFATGAAAVCVELLALETMTNVNSDDVEFRHFHKLRIRSFSPSSAWLSMSTRLSSLQFIFLFLFPSILPLFCSFISFCWHSITCARGTSDRHSGANDAALVDSMRDSLSRFIGWSGGWEASEGRCQASTLRDPFRCRLFFG